VRSVTEVGPGDYVKIGRDWKRIESNSAHGQQRTPRSWTVRTTDGASYGMYDINLYAKASELTQARGTAE
jgi:hypothetical protein